MMLEWILAGLLVLFFVLWITKKQTKVEEVTEYEVKKCEICKFYHANLGIDCVVLKMNTLFLKTQSEWQDITQDERLYEIRKEQLDT